MKIEEQICLIMGFCFGVLFIVFLMAFLPPEQTHSMLVNNACETEYGEGATGYVIMDGSIVCQSSPKPTEYDSTGIKMKLKVGDDS